VDIRKRGVRPRENYCPQSPSVYLSNTVSHVFFRIGTGGTGDKKQIIRFHCRDSNPVRQNCQCNPAESSRIKYVRALAAKRYCLKTIENKRGSKALYAKSLFIFRFTHMNSLGDAAQLQLKNCLTIT
jgi:hypothetical protein